MTADAAQEFEAGLVEVEAGYRAAFAGAKDEQELRASNAKFVGPNGVLTRIMKLMPKLPGERRREFGQKANALKNQVDAAFSETLAKLHRALREAELSGASIDVTLPGRGPLPGRVHPLSRIAHELMDVFTSLGFDIADGPEVELYQYNFEYLGIPQDHPATCMQDTFFVDWPVGSTDARTLLRTHTSPVQVREMLKRKPPLAIVAPGAVYRRDDDVTHSPMFFQIEGLLVDAQVSMADLRGVLTRFTQRMFGPEVPTRFRPSYFPFVEPGGEVDIGCYFCRPWEGDKARTTACRICKRTGWLEVGGCGMVHPVVFEHVGYDPEHTTGFAFGMGIDRLAMLKYGIDDIRLLYENDVRFLGQF